MIRILLAVGLTGLLISSVWALDLVGSLQETMIHEKIKKANYCQTNDDCLEPSFDCPFGCGVYINKKEEPGLRKDIDQYQGASKGCIYDCVRLVDPQCVKGQCVPAVCEADKAYQPFACGCPADTVFLGFSNTPFECIRKNDLFLRMSQLDGQHAPEDLRTIVVDLLAMYRDFGEPEIIGAELASYWRLFEGVSLYDFLVDFKGYAQTITGQRSFNIDVYAFSHGRYKTLEGK